QGATVRVTGQDEVTKAAVTGTAIAADNGLATIAALKPGRYQIDAEFEGFESGQIKDVRLRPGDNKHVVVLELKKLEQTVTVSRDSVAAASDPHGGSLTTQLTTQEINALSDDPNELAQQLQDMAGGNAIIKIDSFVGGALPPKAFIKSIHIVRDTFPAENHSAENDEINIVTQAGVGALRGGLTSRVRDGSLSGRNPFVDVTAPERTTNFEGNLGGTIIPQKLSFSLSGSSRRQFDTPIATYTSVTGKQSILLPERPNDGWSMQGFIDYALTKDQALRVQYFHNDNARKNLGIGGFDLAERAYSNNANSDQFRIQEAGPIGRRFYHNTRFQFRRSDQNSASEFEAQTIRVLDGVTRGGAQVSGGRNTHAFDVISDVNYVRGIHAMRAGVELNSRHERTDDSTNYLGTYIFTGSDSLAGGTPTSYTRRIGDPLITYSWLQTAVYLQDDVKLRKNLTLSPGLRYETQLHVDDHNGFAPRLGLTWAPDKAGKTTVRSSIGVFYNWLNTGVYEQTLRFDGVRQQEINIVNPSFPDPGNSGTVPATNKYFFAPDLQLERHTRFSTAIDRTLTPKVRASFTYALGRFGNQLRGVNLNAPVNSVRPDPQYANVIEATPDASTHMQDFFSDININFAGGDRTAGQPRWNPRRTVLRLNYRYRRTFNNSDGAFIPSPTGSLDAEWAPSSSDTRHRWRGSVSTQALKNFSGQLSLDSNSGGPYTVTTGFDDNGDSLFNDRPILLPRNSERLPWRTTLSANLSYLIPFGGTSAGGPGGGGRGDGGGRGGLGGGAQRGITLILSLQNLTNHDNFVGYSGVMTSAYFLEPTSVANPRQIDFAVRFSF
ncbi:MAG: TonB-dependent receptor, partial [Acidobacteriota bacterium]